MLKKEIKLTDNIELMVRSIIDLAMFQLGNISLIADCKSDLHFSHQFVSKLQVVENILNIIIFFESINDLQYFFS
jgi:hypothetical protein